MAKRVDYQDPLGNLEEVHERRNAEIRAWADKQIRESNERFAAEQEYVTTVDDWDALETSPPQDPPGGEWQLTEEPAQSVENPVDEEEKEADPDAGEKQEAEQEEEKAAPVKKAPAKKAAAAPKEAPSKE